MDSVLCIKGEETDAMITRLFGIHLDSCSRKRSICAVWFFNSDLVEADSLPNAFVAVLTCLTLAGAIFASRHHLLSGTGLFASQPGFDSLATCLAGTLPVHKRIEGTMWVRASK